MSDSSKHRPEPSFDVKDSAKQRGSPNAAAFFWVISGLTIIASVLIDLPNKLLRPMVESLLVHANGWISASPAAGGSPHPPVDVTAITYLIYIPLLLLIVAVVRLIWIWSAPVPAVAPALPLSTPNFLQTHSSAFMALSHELRGSGKYAVLAEERRIKLDERGGCNTVHRRKLQPSQRLVMLSVILPGYTADQAMEDVKFVARSRTKNVDTFVLPAVDDKASREFFIVISPAVMPGTAFEFEVEWYRKDTYAGLLTPTGSDSLTHEPRSTAPIPDLHIVLDVPAAIGPCRFKTPGGTKGVLAESTPDIVNGYRTYDWSFAGYDPTNGVISLEIIKEVR